MKFLEQFEKYNYKSLLQEDVAKFPCAPRVLHHE